MKKVYLAIIAMLVGITLEGSAIGSKNPLCWGAALRCETLGGISKCRELNCISPTEGDVSTSKCVRTFCRSNCIKDKRNDFKCPNEHSNEMDTKGNSYADIDKECQAVCKNVHFGNTSLNTAVRECIAGALDANTAAQQRTYSERIRKDTSTARVAATKWLSDIKKLCDQRKQIYITGIRNIGKVSVEDFTKRTEYLDKKTKILQSTLSLASRYNDAPDIVAKANEAVKASSIEIREYIAAITALKIETEKLQISNNQLTSLSSGKSSPSSYGANQYDAPIVPSAPSMEAPPSRLGKTQGESEKVPTLDPKHNIPVRAHLMFTSKEFEERARTLRKSVPLQARPDRSLAGILTQGIEQRRSSIERDKESKSKMDDETESEWK